MRKQSQIDFFRALVREFPALRPTLAEHIEDFGEILTYLVLADVTRYVLSLIPDMGVHGSKAPKELKEILQYLEKSYVSIDEDVENLIAVGFLENLQQTSESALRILRGLLGLNLSEQLEVVPEN